MPYGCLTWFVFDEDHSKPLRYTVYLNFIIDENYSLNLDAIVLESKMCSLFIVSLSGMLLALDVEAEVNLKR